jgi:hypothetical protein
MKKSFNPLVLLGCLLLMPVTPTRAQAKDIVVGVNLVNAPYDLAIPEQEAILEAMKKAGVRVIRAAIPLGDKGMRFAERVYGHGIEILLEWGFNDAADTCPVDDAARTDLVRELRGEFGQLAKQNRLKGLFFHNWQGNIYIGPSSSN